MRFSQDTAAARRNLNATISSALKVSRNATAIGIVWTDLMRTTANVQTVSFRVHQGNACPQKIFETAKRTVLMDKMKKRDKVKFFVKIISL